MEGGKRSGSSLAYDLFGEKDSPTTGSSSGILGSIFALPPKVLGRELVHSSETEKKHNVSGNPAWNPKTGVSDSNEKVHPFLYSSSIYYGGQDVYNRPPQKSDQNPVFSTFNKDGGEDDSGGASRGNWWQGSLYY